jgi:hypothetical protein
MNSRTIQAIDNTNEIFLMISGYSIIYFSNWIYDVKYNRETDQDISDLPELRYEYGFVYLIFLTTIIGINFFLIIFEIGKALRKKNTKRIYYEKWMAHFDKRIVKGVVVSTIKYVNPNGKVKYFIEKARMWEEKKEDPPKVTMLEKIDEATVQLED